jgi:thiol:disulfide interchange protein
MNKQDHKQMLSRMRPFVIFTLLMTFLFNVSLHSQSKILEPVKWSTSYEAINDQEYNLIFTATIDPGWAIYSQYLEDEDGPIPTSFQYDEEGHFELIGKNEETGNRKEAFDPIFEMNVIKFTKKAIFTQKVKATDLSKPITGYLTYMTCDDERCLPPTDFDFSFQLAAPKEAPAKGESGQAAPKEEAPEEKVATIQLAPTEGEPIADQEAPGQSGILDPVTWTFGKEKVSDTEYDLIFTANMEETWAIYSQFTSDDGPVPTTFYFDENENYERVGKVEESGEKKEGMDPVFGVNVIKFPHGPVTFTQRIKVSDPTQVITGEVEFMACNDEGCLPPRPVAFSIDLQAEGTTTSGAEAGNSVPTDYELAGTPVDYSFDEEWAEQECGEGEKEEEEESSSLLLIFILGFGGGLFAILTPCVFPMIPLTVSFFTKTSTTRAKGISNAISYGLSIIVIYVALGLVITGIFGADALNLLSTNAWFNIFFAVLFIVFAFSFFGFFEITLPSSWANKSDRAAERGGLIGIFFMAFTLSLVSFSCTGPIIGTLLVETATGGGPTLFGRIPFGPLVGMLGFSTALALPFALFAAFPSWLNSLPKSGGWMNTVKVTLGFIEIALALKFLSVADLTMGWKFMPYELFVAVWILCGLGLLLYYLGILRFPHDGPRKKLSTGNGIMAALALALVVYLSMGFRYNEKAETFHTPNLLSGLAPPAGHSYIYPKKCPLNIDCFKDFEEGLTYAKEQGKPILLDFTGHGCVNCRRMEDNVWGKPGIIDMIRNDYVLVSLYVDDREELEEPYTSPFSGRKMRTIGNKWADFQAIHFDRNSQPYYVLLSEDLKVLNEPKAYTPDVDEYRGFLECGLENYQKYKQTGSK